MLSDIVDIVLKNMGHTLVYFAITLYTKSPALTTLHCMIGICVPGTQ